MLLARGTTCMLCMVCSTFYFSTLKVVVLHSQESFFLRIHLNFFSLIRSCTSSQQDLRRLSFLLNSLSLTLQPLRPMLAKVNKTYEQYCHFNDPVVVLLVGKIHRMKFLLYLQPVGSQESQKILPPRDTACISTQLFPFYFCGLLILLFYTPNQSYTPWNHFFHKHIYILFSLIPHSNQKNMFC